MVMMMMRVRLVGGEARGRGAVDAAFGVIITLNFDYLVIVNDNTVLNRRNVDNGPLLVDSLVDWRQGCRHRAAARRGRGVFRFCLDTSFLPMRFLMSLQIELGAESLRTY